MSLKRGYKMLETVSDLLSLAVMIAFAAAGIYALYAVSDLHHSIKLRRHEESFYSLYDDLSDEDDSPDSLNEE
ncbi:MAG: hypothetical protein LKF53_09730 [Solobacterium sp.]|jgi:hypothetical protein|nr:hypothetical protein [Solobacterium sp.]MCH4228069.1 hypothetical protein [Solobacterium sp.]MCH4283501.1 hypothetical protein [Solobacterium sp.]